MAEKTAADYEYTHQKRLYRKDIFKVNPDDIDDEEKMKKTIVDIYEYHKLYMMPRYLYLQDQYEGYHEITRKEIEDTTKPNSKLVNNYPKYITDVSVGYFLGIPVTYESENEAYIDRITEINDGSYEDDQNSEIGKQCSIKGRCYELLYTDEEAEIKFDMIKAEDGFIIYDNGIRPKPLLGVRTYCVTDKTQMHEDEIRVEVYTEDIIYYYKYENGLLSEVEASKLHIFNAVPMIEYINNDEYMGDFEIVMSLINAYNDSQSDTSNDFKAFSDAYLMLINLGGTDNQDLQWMKENKILLLEEQGQAEWLIKNINDTALENYKDRLDKDIAKFSMVPNLTDENFAGQSSGISLAYKLWGLEQLTATKERKMKKSLKKRYKLINTVLELKNVETDNLKMSFYRNIPKNMMELAEMLDKLGGIVSNRSKLEQVPFIENVDDEMDQIKKEMSDELEQMEGDDNVTEE
jgi:SPP1 family phage portal protein